MNNYSELSDYEINKLVAIALGAKMVNAYSVKDVRESIQYDLNGKTLLVTRGFGDGPNRFDPCNSWADAGPIIEKYGIGLHKDMADRWLSDSEAVTHYVIHDNPQRAAMIVFLMMQEAGYAKAA
ncbi:phage protein NinX family protein [Chimaeribacter arupi]|uniref:phage protein NinX family protein n=1 Tax=Chimaeribacter arupi TaxID=2060066 RepID=UPI0013FD07F3|nr:phage protein NinX family protein [Chimaeribacter arupi]